MNMMSNKSTQLDGNQPPQDYNNRTCYECGENGHIGKYFPKWANHLEAKAKIAASSGGNATTNS